MERHVEPPQRHHRVEEISVSELRVEQFVAASPATVFQYFTEASKWAEWQGESATVDPRPGGRFSLVMSNGQRAEGEFLEIDPDMRVVFTWGWIGHPDVPPGSTRVEIDLAEEPTGTRVILTHRYLPADELRPHREGWTTYLPRLAEVVSGA